MRVTGIPYSNADIAVHLPVPFWNKKTILSEYNNTS